MKASNLVTLDTATGEILEQIAPPQNGGFKQCKTQTASGRPVATFTTVLYFPNGEKRTYRSDMELKKLTLQGKKFEEGLNKELQSCLHRFNEFAHECTKAFIFDNRPEKQNDNVVVKSVAGTIVKSKWTRFTVGTVLLYKFQNNAA